MRIPFTLAAASMVAASPAIAAPDDFAAEARQLLERSYDGDGPGAVALVVDDGEVIFRGAVGRDDLAAGTALSTSRYFRLGSITKQFTSAMIMKLVEDGDLSLDDRLGDLLPGMPTGWRAVTLHQLLNHSSGIPSYTANPANFDPAVTVRAHSTGELIALFRDDPMDFAPGGEFRYNNSGYILLGAIIEEVTDQPWFAAIRDRLLEPNGIDQIHYVADYAAYPGLVASYTGGEEATPSQRLDGSLPHAAGALIGTLDGLHDWTRALHEGRIVGRDSLAVMTRPTALPDGSQQAYGYGLQVPTLADLELVGHGGGIFGFTTYSAYAPSEDLFVAVFANSDSPRTAPTLTANRLLLLASDETFPTFSEQPLDEAALVSRVGRYRFSDDAVRDLYVEDGSLFFRREGSRAFEIKSAGEGRFFYEDSLNWFEMSEEEGRPRIAYYADASSDPVMGERIGDVPEAAAVELTADQRARMAGRYRFERLGVLTVSAADDGPIMVQMEGQPPFEARPLDIRTLIIDAVGARLSFQPGPFFMTSVTIRQGGAELVGTRIEE